MNEILSQFRDARIASRNLLLVDKETINKMLLALADAAVANTAKIIEANKKDLSRMDPKDPKYDRLLLNEARIAGIASDIRNVATLTSPVGDVLDRAKMDNGMEIRRVVVPFGVIGVIYESRPNVSFDVFSL